MHKIEDKTIAQAARTLAKLRTQRKEIEAEEKKLKPIVRNYMIENDLKRARTFEGYRVHCDPSTRTYLDETAVCQVLNLETLDSFRGKRAITPSLSCHTPKGGRTFLVSGGKNASTEGKRDLDSE